MPVASLTHSITHFVGANGIYAVFVLMLIDAVFPAASELVMVYGGALASGAVGGAHVVLIGNRIHSHTASYIAIAATGTLGYLVGSWVGWLIGARAGRPFVERHASAFHLDPHKLARADDWFRRYGLLAVLVGRITPVIRSFVSIPAGFERMPFGPYTSLTLAGSAVWSFGLAGAGWAIGTGYQHFHHAFDYVSVAAVSLVIAAIALLTYRRRRVGKAEASIGDI
jgi:membrane protein DedA with SNARE-associated domain